MSSYDALRRELLSGRKYNPTGSVQYPLSKLSIDFGLPEADIGEVLSVMVSEGLIDASTDGVYAKVTVTAAGAELLSGMSKASVGFGS
jgi:hypothetical protein